MDIAILQLLGTTAGWKRFSGYIKPHHLSRECATIYRTLKGYHDSHSSDVNWREYKSYFAVRNALSEGNMALYSRIFEQLQKPQDINGALHTALIERDYATRIAETAYRIAEGGQADISEVGELYERCRKELKRNSSSETAIVTDDIEDLLAHTVGQGGLSWRLPELNTSLGPLRVGDFVCFAARVEMGKSSMLASEVSHMARQLPPDEHVVFFSNEEDGRKVKLRVIQAALGCKLDEIRRDPIAARDKYTALVGRKDRIIIYDRASITVSDIASVLNDYKPGLIVFDQLHKIRGFDKMERTDVQRLGMVFGYARELAKEHAPVITAHQASSAAVGKLYPELEDIDGSRTALQAELDALILIGASEAAGEYVRGLSVVKNKLAGCQEERFRHGQFEVIIEPEIARYHSPSTETYK